MKKTLNRDQIVAISDIKTEYIDVPEWGGTVALRELTGAERDAFEAQMVKTVNGKREADMANLRAKLVAACLVDGQTGDRLFDDKTIHQLGNKSAVALDRLFRVAQRMNGMDGPDGGVQEQQKNSFAAPSGSSTSD